MPEDNLKKKGLLPKKWNPKTEADKILKSLIKVTSDYVKGAHDGEFVCGEKYAYVVSLVNDARAGENPYWLDLYSTLSIVSLEKMEVVKRIDFAKGGQQFKNETLPPGSCTVPRIIWKDKNTVRCYFASENPGKRQSQMWYRDFYPAEERFDDCIYKAKILTASGLHDMQPQYFLEDAAVNGNVRKPLDFGVFFVDSFKRFDNKTYVVINNFFAELNALAVLHEDFETFEILGHYNKPFEKRMSESAVNRLPDGRWVAVCRSEMKDQTYLFTTSKDGKNWEEARELPFVRDGSQSKPVLERFHGVYYLGWQDKATCKNVIRSVFNVDVSRDFIHWERKYRFESAHSFQYPTFHEHDGTIGLTVTQGDTDATPHAMYKERIMFGKLEDIN